MNRLCRETREFVQEACQRRENIFGPAFFDQHLAVVAECAASLAAPMGAEIEVVDLAAYLHDLSAVCDFATMLDHARVSADLATRILLGKGFPQSIVGSVARSIASHSEPIPIGSASPEEVCISNADAVARILRPAYWMYFVFEIRKYDFEAGRQWLRALIERQWRKLIEPARELVGERYAATLKLLVE
jgi:putative nucleotidyltransferase with HDIG domain